MLRFSLDLITLFVHTYNKLLHTDDDLETTVDIFIANGNDSFELMLEL